MLYFNCNTTFNLRKNNKLAACSTISIIHFASWNLLSAFFCAGKRQQYFLILIIQNLKLFTLFTIPFLLLTSYLLLVTCYLLLVTCHFSHFPFYIIHHRLSNFLKIRFMQKWCVLIEFSILSKLELFHQLSPFYFPEYVQIFYLNKFQDQRKIA